MKTKKIINVIPGTNYNIHPKVMRSCRFEDGVFIYNDGEGDDYFSCDLPLCNNGDQIWIGDVCEVTFDDITVDIVGMELQLDVHSYWIIIFKYDDGQMHKVPGLFHSKYIFEYATTKASETLSLSHVLKAIIAIQIQGKIPCDCPTLNESNGANATSIFSLSDITDIMNLVFDSPIASNSLSKAFGCFS